MSGREKPLILQNGIPIPQAYDKDLGDWTEYSTEHIKAIKAELALVKAELQEIKANQLSGDQKVQLKGRATVVAMGLNEVIPPGVEIFRPAVAEAPVIQAHRRYGFVLTFVAAPTEKRRARVNLALRRLMPNGSKSGGAQYVMGDRVNVLVADGSPSTPTSLIMEPVHVPAEWINFGILNTGTEDVTVNWYIVEV